MLEFLKLAASAFLGMLAAFGVQWLKSSRDELRLICDDFCKALSESADLASAYWLKQSNDEQITVLEGRLIGRQSQLTGFQVLVSDWFRSADRDRLSEDLAVLFDAMTGGDFRVTGRGIDIGRCNAVQLLAATTIVDVRHGYRNSVAVRGIVGRWSDRPRRSAATFANAMGARAAGMVAVGGQQIRRLKDAAKRLSPRPR